MPGRCGVLWSKSRCGHAEALPGLPETGKPFFLHRSPGRIQFLLLIRSGELPSVSRPSPASQSGVTVHTGVSLPEFRVGFAYRPVSGFCLPLSVLLELLEPLEAELPSSLSSVEVLLSSLMSDRA